MTPCCGASSPGSIPAVGMVAEKKRKVISLGFESRWGLCARFVRMTSGPDQPLLVDQKKEPSAPTCVGPILLKYGKFFLHNYQKNQTIALNFNTLAPFQSPCSLFTSHQRIKHPAMHSE